MKLLIEIIKKLLTKRPFTYFQRCCLCNKFGVQTGFHYYMDSTHNGKTCENCFIDMFIEIEE